MTDDDVLLRAVALVVAEHAARIVEHAAEDARTALEGPGSTVDMGRSSGADYRAGWLGCVAHLRRYAADMSAEDPDR